MKSVKLGSLEAMSGDGKKKNIIQTSVTQLEKKYVYKYEKHPNAKKAFYEGCGHWLVRKDETTVIDLV